MGIQQALLTGGPFFFTLTPGANVNVRTQAVAAGWNQSAPVVATLNGAATSSTAATPACTIAGSFPGGITLNNNSSITGATGGTGATGAHGAAGAGGAGGFNSVGVDGSAGGAAGNGGTGITGGTALSVTTQAIVNNVGTLSGGGGGPGGVPGTRSGGGGGGGGGTTVGKFDNPASGGNGGNGYSEVGGPYAGTTLNGVTGGSGGASATAGSAGQSASYSGGSGGAGGGAGSGGVSGAVGNYISGNANVTWLATGTRTGGVA